MIRTVEVTLDGGNPELQRKEIVDLLRLAADKVEGGDDSFYLYHERGEIAGEVVIRWD